MESIDDALFGLSEKAESDRERNMYFEAMREIRMKRTAIQAGFDQAMESSFAQLAQNTSSSIDEFEPEELSLVELDEIEDNIAIDNMISKARPNFEDDLFAVLERLKIVTQRDDIDEDTNPLDPRAICDSFHKASDVLETDIQIKLIFYKLFDKYVMSNLGHFYQEMNEYFMQKGILPEFKASKERLKQTTKFMANRIKASTGQANLLGETHSKDSSGIPVSEGLSANTDGNLLAVLQQALSGSANQSVFGENMTGVSGSASDLIDIRNVTSDGSQVSGLNIVPAAQNNAYMSALTSLQMANIADAPAQNIDLQNFKQSMHQQLLNFNQENQHHTSASDNQIIDIVSMLFDFFLDDESLPDPVKVLIGRLQIPILKAAMIDSNFFNQKKHPARQLLDNISKASLGWNQDVAQEKILIDKIESVVNYILGEFENNIEVFDLALTDLNSFLSSEAEKIQQAEETVIQHEKDNDRLVSEAQDAVSNLISRICEGRGLSFEVTDFLDTIWSSVLFHAYLSLGKTSIHWKNLRRITTTLVWTLVPKFREEERIKILQTLPALLRALSKGMNLVNISTDQQNRIFKILAQEHARAVKQTTRNIITRVDDETIWPDDDHIARAFQGLSEKGSKVIDIVSSDGLDKAETGADDDLDSITEITVTATKDVIHNLEDFTTSVSMGAIEVDEEIIIESSEQAKYHATPLAEDDEFLEQARSLEIGTWVEFTELDASQLNTRLSWKSNVTGKLVFSNRHGAKVKSMSVNAFAIELRSGRAKNLTSSSVFDRAINTIMTTIKH